MERARFRKDQESEILKSWNRLNTDETDVIEILRDENRQPKEERDFSLLSQRKEKEKEN